jgi:tyrosinase
LFLHAADIAKSLGQEDVLQRFRIPYFDPLLPRQKLANQDSYTYGVPIIFTLPQIQVFRTTTPTKQWEPAPNPLYSFKFPSNLGGGWDWAQDFGQNYDPILTKQTIRGYDGDQSQGGYFNHTFVMQTFDNAYNPGAPTSSSDAQSVWRVLLGQQNWITMSNHYDPSNRRKEIYDLNSVEGFHDDIHTYLGSGPQAIQGNAAGGHMANVPHAGQV